MKVKTAADWKGHKLYCPLFTTAGSQYDILHHKRGGIVKHSNNIVLHFDHMHRNIPLLRWNRSSRAYVCHIC